jgi:circadian clock protein KaiC
MMKDHKAKLLFIDGMRSLRDLWGNEAKLRDFLYDLNVAVAQLGAISILTTEYPLAKLMEYPEATTVDAILSLSMQRFGGRVVRRAQVAKLRGRKHLSGDHVMHITDAGIDVVPRLEEVITPAPQFTPSTRRAAFGLPEMDVLLSGGLPCLSTTLLAGSTGVGRIRRSR